jgi:hypothetical protein
MEYGEVQLRPTAERFSATRYSHLATHNYCTLGPTAGTETGGHIRTAGGGAGRYVSVRGSLMTPWSADAATVAGLAR